MNLLDRIDPQSPYLQVCHRWRGPGGPGVKHERFAFISRVMSEIFRSADGEGGEARLDLSELKLAAEERMLLVQYLLQIDYFVPLGGQTPAPGAGGWMRCAGMRAPLASSIAWEKGGIGVLVVQLSPLVVRLLPRLRAERGLPGKYTRALFGLVGGADVRWPLEVSIEDLHAALFPSGHIPPSLLTKSNFWNMVVLPAVSMVRKFTRLQLSAERIMGTLEGHYAVLGVRFYADDDAAPSTAARGSHPSRGEIMRAQRMRRAAQKNAG